MENTPKTLAQIQDTIKAARDSVWVITDEIKKLTAGESPTKSHKGNIDRNVEHLKLVVVFVLRNFVVCLLTLVLFCLSFD